jgi:acetyltransferase-like isoleucine patch superfamily enzyme
MAINQGSDVFIHQSVRAYGRNCVGDHGIILEDVILGYPTADILLELRAKKTAAEYLEYSGTTFGPNVVIRSHSVFYRDVQTGHHVRSGHRVMVREGCRIGDHVLLGSNVVIDSYCKIGSHVSIQSNVYIPTGTEIGDYAFLGPNCVILNDRYPIRTGSKLEGPVLERGVTVGGGATILPRVRLGEGAFVAAGAIVTKDVPAWHFAIGSPAVMSGLPDELRVLNKIE